MLAAVECLSLWFVSLERLRLMSNVERSNHCLTLRRHHSFLRLQASLFCCPVIWKHFSAAVSLRHGPPRSCQTAHMRAIWTPTVGVSGAVCLWVLRLCVCVCASPTLTSRSLGLVCHPWMSSRCRGMFGETFRDNTVCGVCAWWPGGVFHW